jgi:ligand-binding SRPBCC domain-containing protein
MPPTPPTPAIPPAQLQRRQYQVFIDRVPEAVFAFLASLRNHSRLCPADASEEVVAPSVDSELRVGERVALRVKRGGGANAPWQSMVVEVTEYDPPHGFAWRQVEGPYAAWTHRRRLAPFQDGTLVTDIVEYLPTGGALGRLADKLGAGKQMDEAFRFRQQEAKRLIERISRIKGRDAL